MIMGIHTSHINFKGIWGVELKFSQNTQFSLCAQLQFIRFQQISIRN